MRASSTSAARARPIWRASAPPRVGLGLEFLPWPIVIPLAILAVHGGGRLLGLDPRHPAGQARQPHRHHHHHVQLHRREPDGLSHQLLVPPGGQDGGGEPRDHRRLHHELRARWRASSSTCGSPPSPLNFSVFLAIIAAFAVWYLLWRTKLGYEIRAVGANPTAAVYAGIKPDRIIIITMAISGALAGLMAVNEILGVQHRLRARVSSAAPASSASPWR